MQWRSTQDEDNLAEQKDSFKNVKKLMKSQTTIQKKPVATVLKRNVTVKPMNMDQFNQTMTVIHTLINRKNRVSTFEEVGLCDPDLERKDALKKVNKWYKGLHFDDPVDPKFKIRKNYIP